MEKYLNNIKSKRGIFIPLAFLIVFMGCFQEKEYAPKEILLRSYSSIKAINSGYFDIATSQKYFFNNNTYNQKYSCLYFYGDTSVASLNLMFFNELSDVFGYDIYRNKEHWNTDTEKKEVFMDTSKQDFTNLDFRFFENRGYRLYKVANNDTTYKFYNKGDTLIEKELCYGIEVFQDTKAQGDTLGTYWKWIFYINKQNFMPKKIISECDYLGEIQHEEAVFSNFKIFQNKDSTAHIIDSKLLWVKQNFKQMEYSDLINKRDSLESVKISKIDFKNSGIQTLNGKKVDMYKQKSKLTLIDFWYVSCHPCLKAIPTLDKLYNKYKDKGLDVIGINASDKDTALINKIIRKKDINYTIYKDGKKLAEKYNVYGFPTFFLLDENYNVIHKEVGFSEGDYKKLDSLVKANLK